jgi:hypothetical protein
MIDEGDVRSIRYKMSLRGPISFELIGVIYGCGLFCDAISFSDCVALNGKMVDEQ